MAYYLFVLGGATTAATFGFRGYGAGWVVFTFFSIMLLGELAHVFRWPGIGAPPA